MKKLWFIVTATWQPIVTVAFVTLVVAFLLLFRISTLVPGAHELETTTRGQKQSLKALVDDPVNAPFYVSRAIVQKFHKNQTTTARIVAASFGAISLLSFYLLAQFWYRQRIAILGTVLFAGSSWFLHVARFGTADILLSLIVLFMLLSTWLQRTKQKPMVVLVTCITSAILLYVPGMIWFIGAGILWRGRQYFKKNSRSLHPLIVAGYCLFVVLLTPLIVAIVKQPHILRNLAGIPNGGLSINTYLHTIATTFLEISIWSKINPIQTIGHLPFLDIFSTVMVIIGIYASLLARQLDRNKSMLGLFVMALLLAGLGGPITSSLLLPIVYLFVMSGIAYFLDEWFRVFPRNPLAGNIGAIFMTVVVATTVFYHINSYFIAWPNTPRTRSAFSQRLN